MHSPVWVDVQAFLTILLKAEEKSVGAERHYQPGSCSQRWSEEAVPGVQCDPDSLDGREGLYGFSGAYFQRLCKK